QAAVSAAWRRHHESCRAPPSEAEAPAFRPVEFPLPYPSSSGDFGTMELSAAASRRPGRSKNRKPCIGPMLLRPLTADFIELCLAHRIGVDDVDNFPQVSAATA